MNLTAVASEIVLKMQDESWQKQEERILRALSEAYRLGFLDGEASTQKATANAKPYRHEDSPDAEACPV